MGSSASILLTGFDDAGHLLSNAANEKAASEKNTKRDVRFNGDAASSSQCGETRCVSITRSGEPDDVLGAFGGAD
jgi:hypothetical protein